MTDSAPLHWCSAARTHVGKVRKLNEDACLERPEAGLWAVADGMGGHAAGDFASGAIVEALKQAPPTPDLEARIRQVTSSLDGVNEALCREARRRREQVIGSTVAVLLASDDRHAVVLWAGDSRIYRLRGRRLEQLTRDHSHVEELIARGVLKREEAGRHPASNAITRAVGVMEHVEYETRRFDVQDGDVFLLCSDGLYNEVAEDDMARALASGDCTQAADQLLQLALANRARDNITVVVVLAQDADQATRTQFNPSASRPGPGGDDDPTTLNR